MEKTIEIQLAEHGERIAQAIIGAIRGDYFDIHWATIESYRTRGLLQAANLARTTK